MFLSNSASASGGCSALLSYASCAGFVRDFDRIYSYYNGKGSTEQNPMRRTPTIGLTKSGTMVFEDVTFPLSYSFTQDAQGTGVKSWQGYNNAPQVKMECVIILSACLHSPLTSISFKHSSPLTTVNMVYQGFGPC